MYRMFDDEEAPDRSRQPHEYVIDAKNIYEDSNRICASEHIPFIDTTWIDDMTTYVSEHHSTV